jgi:hypothetical protein
MTWSLYLSKPMQAAFSPASKNASQTHVYGREFKLPWCVGVSTASGAEHGVKHTCGRCLL